MHITAYIFRSNLKHVVKNITQIIDVIIGKTPCILLLVTALCLCRRCQYISFWEQVFCTCLSFQNHSGRAQMLGTAGEGQLAEVFVRLEHCRQAISLVRSVGLAPLLLISGSMQRFAERECFFSHAAIYCCGLLSTRKSDCTGLPPSMLNNPDTPPSRGQYRIRMKGNMSLICWYNKGHFRFLTNAYSPVQQGKQYCYCSSGKCTCFKWQGKMSHGVW